MKQMLHIGDFGQDSQVFKQIVPLICKGSQVTGFRLIFFNQLCCNICKNTNTLYKYLICNEGLPFM